MKTTREGKKEKRLWEASISIGNPFLTLFLQIPKTTDKQIRAFSPLNPLTVTFLKPAEASASGCSLNRLQNCIAGLTGRWWGPGGL